MLAFFTNYYGIDVAGMVLTLLSIYLLGKKNKAGFIFGALGSIFWIIFNIWVNTIPGLILSFLIVILNIKGYLNWKKDEPTK